MYLLWGISKVLYQAYNFLSNPLVWSGVDACRCDVVTVMFLGGWLLPAGNSLPAGLYQELRTELIQPTVSIVIPALNEERNIPHVFEEIPADVHQVILVDGRSTDNTVAAARAVRPDVCIVSQNRKGKGNALACGFLAATGDVIAMVDADGSADPAEIPRFVAALEAGADFAKGTRFAQGGGSDDITGVRRLGNRALTKFFNFAYSRDYTDLCYGYNVFWRKHLPVLGLDASTPMPADGTWLWGDGFEVETLIHIRVAKSGLKVAEVPSHERSRIHGVSNLNAPRDGIRVVRTMVAERGGLFKRHLPQPSANDQQGYLRRESVGSQHV